MMQIVRGTDRRAQKGYVFDEVRQSTFARTPFFDESSLVAHEQRDTRFSAYPRKNRVAYAVVQTSGGYRPPVAPRATLLDHRPGGSISVADLLAGRDDRWQSCRNEERQVRQRPEKFSQLQSPSTMHRVLARCPSISSRFPIPQRTRDQMFVGAIRLLEAR